MSYDDYPDSRPDPDLAGLIADLHLHPDLVDVDVAALPASPYDVFIAHAVEAGYAGTDIGKALGIDPKLVRLHLWRLVAQGVIDRRGDPEVPLPELTASEMYRQHLDRMAAFQASKAAEHPNEPSESWLATAQAIILRASGPQEGTEKSIKILEAAYHWQSEHPYEQLNIARLGRELGMTRQDTSYRIKRLRTILSDHRVQLPRIFEGDSEDVLRRIEAVVESEPPTSPEDMEQRLDISRWLIKQAQERLLARRVVRTIRSAVHVRRAAVAVLRATQSLGGDEIARLLDIELPLVTSDLERLRARDPTSTRFVLRDRHTRDENEAFKAFIGGILDSSPEARPADVARRIAEETGEPYNSDLIQRVKFVMHTRRHEADRGGA